jgi:hypothetical protein
MSEVIRGSCLCGGVRFEVRGKPLTMAYCHCSRCRKVGGHANVTVRAEDFHWLAGEDLLVRYEPEPPFNLIRCFCGACGTYLGEPDTDPRAFPIAAHAFDDEPGIQPVLHEYAEGPPLAAFFPKDRSTQS